MDDTRPRVKVESRGAAARYPIAAAHGHEANALLFDFTGVATNVWTRESIARVKTKMRLSYYAVFPLVALAILCTVQAVQVGRRPARR